MAHQCHNFVLDDSYRILGPTTFTNGNGVVFNGATVIDLGQVAPGFNINTSSTAPYGRFAVVMDWTACNTTLQSPYYISIQGADDAAFSSGVTRLALTFLGVANQSGNEFDTPAQGREVFYFDNVSVGSASASQNTKRFLRVSIIHFGPTGTPNLVLSGMWLVPI